VVAQFGAVAALGDLESGLGLVIGDRHGIVHMPIVASGAGGRAPDACGVSAPRAPGGASAGVAAGVAAAAGA
jgi:hypothetical protein